MPHTLQRDIDWRRTRIAFYQQALETLNVGPDFPSKSARQGGLADIIANLNRTLSYLERELSGRR